MNKIKILIITIFALIITETKSYEDVKVSFGFFYNSLSPYGEWIEIEPDFFVWRPIGVRYGWRPYWDGRWVWTRYGWYWVSHEPFGWAVFHYGRWYYDDYYGWIWIPGFEWAPAWVEWRYDDHYIGWAPLPPYALFKIEIGIHFTRSWNWPAHHWNFVRYKHFHNPNITHYYEKPERVKRFFGNTRRLTELRYEDNRIINRGIEPSMIERRTNERIRTVEIIETNKSRGDRFLQENNRIEIYRPSAIELENIQSTKIEARKPERNIRIETDKIDRSIFGERTRVIRENDRRTETQYRSEQNEIERKSEIKRSNRDTDKQKFERRGEFKPERREREIEIRRERTPPQREPRSEPKMREKTREEKPRPENKTLERENRSRPR